MIAFQASAAKPTAKVRTSSRKNAPMNGPGTPLIPPSTAIRMSCPDSVQYENSGTT